MHEKQKQDKEEPPSEVAESSAQGEARGNIVINTPYCYHCLTRGMQRKSALCNCFVTFVKNLFAMTCGMPLMGLAFTTSHTRRQPDQELRQMQPSFGWLREK
jgi:hypothetical protein